MALPRTRSTRIRTVLVPRASCPTASPVTVTSARISPTPRCAITTLRSQARLCPQGWVTIDENTYPRRDLVRYGSVNARSRPERVAVLDPGDVARSSDDPPDQGAQDQLADRARQLGNVGAEPVADEGHTAHVRGLGEDGVLQL